MCLQNLVLDYNVSVWFYHYRLAIANVYDKANGNNISANILAAVILYNRIIYEMMLSSSICL